MKCTGGMPKETQVNHDVKTEDVIISIPMTERKEFVRTCSLRLCTDSAHVHRALKKSDSGNLVDQRRRHIAGNKLYVTDTDFIKCNRLYGDKCYEEQKNKPVRPH